MKSKEEILVALPYQKPFLFVDDILEVSADGCSGFYFIKDDEYFFKGHFPGNPVVPGVIITEIMAQIGLVCLGIYLIDSEDVLPVFTSSNVDFLEVVKPGERLTVESKKEYFRFGKLKCKIVCRNERNEIVARGECSGMMIKKNH